MYIKKVATRLHDSVQQLISYSEPVLSLLILSSGNSVLMSTHAACFENENELDIFPPKWDRKEMSHCLVSQILTFMREFKDITTAILTIFQLRLGL